MEPLGRVTIVTVLGGILMKTKAANDDRTKQPLRSFRGSHR